MDAEERTRLERAMEGLSADHRAVLRLIHEKGVSMSEAAVAMGRSPAAVRKLHARAVVALSESLETT
jgi:RNA polymerase sigma-70 factor (ECF subfamily)